MNTTNFVRLKLYERGQETDLDIGLVGTSSVSAGTKVVNRFSETEEYLAGSLVLRNGVINCAIEDVPAGRWKPAQWKNVDGSFSVLTRFNQRHTYEPNSIVVHPRKEEVVYTLTGQPKGDFVDEAWLPLEEVDEIRIGYSYLDPDSEVERPESFVASPAKLNDKNTGPNSYLEYFDAFFDTTDPTNMAANPDGTGEVTNETRVKWIRDLSGKENHGIQINEEDAPWYIETAPGTGYLWFRINQHFKIPGLEESTDHYVALGRRGIAEFNRIQNDNERDPGCRIGIKNELLGKDWRMTGEGIAKNPVPEEEMAKAVAQLEYLNLLIPESERSPMEMMFENEHRLLKLLPGFDGKDNAYRACFKNCRIFKSGVSEWDMSEAVNTVEMFYGCQFFNDDVSAWSTGSIVSMQSMFEGAYRFDQDLSRWNTGSVTNTSYMFKNAVSFNNGGVPLLQDFISWQMSSVTNMEGMFHGAMSFNQMIHNWRMTNVINIKSMFEEARAFNQNISAWDLPNLSLAENFLYGAVSFNKDLSRICVPGILSMPTGFAEHTEIENEAGLQPQWGGCTPRMYFAEFDYTNPGNMAANPDGTGVVKHGTRVRYVEDISGNNFHARQSDVSKAPVYLEISPGVGYLVFENDHHLRVNGITDSVSRITGFVGQGSAVFGSVPGELSGAYLGINNPVTEKKWELSGEVIATTGYTPEEKQTMEQLIDQRALALTTIDVPVMHYKFANETTLQNFVSTWNIGEATDLEAMFQGASQFNVDIGNWDVSNVTNLKSFLSGCQSFAGELVTWDTSSVTDFSFMFASCHLFNSDISGWVTSSATKMVGMFTDCLLFNTDISAWDYSNVTDINNFLNGAAVFDQKMNNMNLDSAVEAWGMFRNCTAFNNGGYALVLDLENVTSLSNFFQNATSFNQMIVGCNFDNATHVDGMFAGAESFNQDISSLSATLVSVEGMFDGALSFNQSINTLDFSEVISIKRLLKGATSFNNNGEALDLVLRKCNDATEAFMDCSSFDLPIDHLEVMNVTSWKATFKNCVLFDQDFSNYRLVGKVNTTSMFEGCSLFNQDLGHWDMSEVTDADMMFASCLAFEGVGLDEWTLYEDANINYMLSNTTSLTVDLSGWNIQWNQREGILDSSNLLNFPDRLPQWY